jgi:hypothetical protein
MLMVLNSPDTLSWKSTSETEGDRVRLNCFALEYLHPDTERLEELKKKMREGRLVNRNTMNIRN